MMFPLEIKNMFAVFSLMSFLVCLQLCLVSCDYEVGEKVRNLRGDLLKNYDKNARPSKNLTAPTVVKMLFDVHNVVELDEKNQILTVKGVLMMTWTDEHLVWNDEYSGNNEYAGIKMIRFANHEIWQPDIYSLFNVKENHLYSDASSTLMLVSNTGSVRWYPSAVFDVPCSTQFRHYPFDEHNCTIVFGSWTHAGESIVLEAFSTQVNSHDSVAPTQWLIKDVSHENYIYRFGESITYHTVTVTVNLQRTTRIYKYVCVIPILISVVTTLSGFWLEASETSRYMIGCSNVIMMSLLMQHLAVAVPAGKEVPLIAEYSASSLCIATSFLLVSIIVTLIGQSSSAPPTTFVRLARQSIDRFLCLSTFIREPDSQCMSAVVTEAGTGMTSFDDAQKAKDWELVALVVDRVAFWVFVVVYVILIAVLASV